MNCKFLAMTNLGQFPSLTCGHLQSAYREQNKERIFVQIKFFSCFSRGHLHICLICHQRDRRNGFQVLKLHFSFEPLRQAEQSLQSTMLLSQCKMGNWRFSPQHPFSYCSLIISDRNICKIPPKYGNLSRNYHIYLTALGEGGQPKR